MNTPHDPAPDWLETQLADEARRDVPPFDPALHARVLKAVAMQRHVRFWWRFGASVAVAAAVLVAVGIWMRPAPPPRPEFATPTHVPSVADFLPSRAVPDDLRQLAKDGRLAYLDQDAVRLGRFVLDRLSVIPQPAGP